MPRSDFDDHWDRMSRAHRRTSFLAVFVVAWNVFLMLAMAAAIIWSMATFVRLGPEGIAARAGAAMGAFDRAWAESR